jgi:hypothetical protein
VSQQEINVDTAQQIWLADLTERHSALQHDRFGAQGVWFSLGRVFETRRSDPNQNTYAPAKHTHPPLLEPGRDKEKQSTARHMVATASTLQQPEPYT